jgi:alpha-ketoglutarate-dependent taurine dioxygenase
MSFAQQRLWFLEQLDPGKSAFNIPTAVRFKGSFRLETLRQVLDEIVRRHESLRTSFFAVDGRPTQQILAHLRLEPLEIDLGDLDPRDKERTVRRLLEETSQAPFDLSRAPLLRVVYLRSERDEYVVSLTTHHIVSDAWSRGVLIRETAELYRRYCDGAPSSLSEIEIQYADFSCWQRERMTGDVLEAELSYWKHRLAGDPPALQLPFDYPRPQRPSYRGEARSFEIPEQLAAELKALSRREGATLFMTLLAAYQALLFRASGQEDFLVGSDIANRNQYETEPLIGFFVNQIALRADLSGDPTFQELLQRVRRVVLEAYAHQDLPFEKLVEALKPRRDQSQNPLFQVKIVLQNAPTQPLQLPGLTLTPMEGGKRIARYDLTLFLSETEQGLRGTLEWSADLFKPAAAARFATDYLRWFEIIVHRPDARISDLVAALNQMESEQKMTESEQRALNNFGKFKRVTRKTVTLPQELLISADTLSGSNPLPLVVSPLVDGVDLIDWAMNNRDYLQRELFRHGGVLFRGFGIDSANDFERVATAICPDLFDGNGELPRANIYGKVYTPVEYPSDKPILWHNENTFCPRWPMKIFFGCLEPARAGGETPIVDSREVFRRINPAIRNQFAERKIMYLRNYDESLGLGWRTVFQTEDRAKVEEYCRKHSIEFEWKERDRLRTRAVRPAVARHPGTGEFVWFNQATHWHLSCLGDQVRNVFEASFAEYDLPRNCYYGDGRGIEDQVMQEICEVYRSLEVSFSWRRGDILALDNMLTAHARNPYQGPRKIAVTMGEMVGDEIF